MLGPTGINVKGTKIAKVTKNVFFIHTIVLVKVQVVYGLVNQLASLRPADSIQTNFLLLTNL